MDNIKEKNIFYKKFFIWLLVFGVAFSPLLSLHIYAATGYPVPHILSISGLSAANGEFLPVAHTQIASTAYSSESAAQTYMFHSGRWSGLRVYTNSPNASGSSTLTLRVNGADTALTVTIPQNSTGVFQDLSDYATVSVGDLVSLGVTTTAGTIPLISITYLFETDNGDTVQYFKALAGGNFTSTNRYIMPATNSMPNNISSEVNAQNIIQHSATVVGISAFIGTNTRTGTANITARVGAASGNNSVSIPTTQTGLFTDTGSQSISAGQRLNSLVTMGGSGVVTPTYVSLAVTSTNPREITFIHGVGMARNSSLGDQWNFAGGRTLFSTSSESIARSYPVTPGVFSGLAYYASANTATQNLVMLMRKNASDANQNITYSGTGWIQDTTNSDSFGLNDFSTIRTTRSASGSGTTTFQHHSIKYTMDEILPTFTQSAYRFYSNNNSTDVGSSLALQDTPVTLASAGDAFRLRLLLNVYTNRLNLSGQDFKLQYVGKGSGTCASPTGGTPSSYTDITDSTLIAYNNNASPSDGNSLTSNAGDPTNGGNVIVNQTYEELNNFTNSISSILAGQDGKWDFSLKDNGASAGSTYCIRAVKSDGSLLDSYSVYPEISIPGVNQSISFSISDNTIGFGALTPSSLRYATGDTNGSASETIAHTLSVTTNATSGYSVSVKGDTLRNGSFSINSCGASCTPSSGTEQFGIRVTASGGTGTVSSPYNHPTNYAYEGTSSVSDEIASASSGDGVETVYSIRYLANVSSTTESGEYSSAYTFSVTPSF